MDRYRNVLCSQNRCFRSVGFQKSSPKWPDLFLARSSAGDVSPRTSPACQCPDRVMLAVHGFGLFGCPCYLGWLQGKITGNHPLEFPFETRVQTLPALFFVFAFGVPNIVPFDQRLLISTCCPHYENPSKGLIKRVARKLRQP